MDVASVIRKVNLCPADQVLLALVLALIEGSPNQRRIRLHLLELAAHPGTSQQVRELIDVLSKAVAGALQEASHA